MSDNVKFPNANAAADTPQTALLTPDQTVEQLRALVASIPDVPALTEDEMKLLKRRKRMPEPEIRASIEVVGASEKVSQAIGKPVEDVRLLLEAADHWTPVEVELRAALKAVVDTNLVRRQRATVVAMQAYGIAQQLARDPENAAVAAHVKEIKRLKALRRRKAPVASAPQTADPAKS